MPISYEPASWQSGTLTQPLLLKEQAFEPPTRPSSELPTGLGAHPHFTPLHSVPRQWENCPLAILGVMAQECRLETHTAKTTLLSISGNKFPLKQYRTFFLESPRSPTCLGAVFICFSCAFLSCLFFSSSSSSSVFLSRLTYLLESQSYRGREGKRERRIFHRIGSFPKCLQHQDRARLKSGCRSFPHEFREPKHCFFQANNREMDMKWNSQDMNWHP